MIVYVNCSGISGGNPSIVPRGKVSLLTVRLPCVAKPHNPPKQPTAVTTVKLAPSMLSTFASNPSTTVSSSVITIAKPVVTHVGLTLSKSSKNNSN
jgi:hypothetical protein